MNFDEWDENKTVFPNSMEKGYARAAWNAAIDEAVKAVEKSFVVDEDGNSWTAKQRKIYTTTVPDDDANIIVFSNYWVSAPKENFVLVEG